MTTEPAGIGTFEHRSKTGLGSRFAGLLARLRAWRAKRRSLAHLSELADWQLDDIGLTRSEAEEALRAHGFRRDHVHLTQWEQQR